MIRYPYVRLEVPATDLEIVDAELWSLGATGIEHQDDATLIRSADDNVCVIAHFEASELARDAIAHVGERYPASLQYIEGDAWRDEWKKHFRVQSIGQRLVVKPSWLTHDAKDRHDEQSKVVVDMDPGRAFGSGIHETTRLMLHCADRYVQGGESVCDIGCGSGIVAIAALKLGANHAVLIDNDEHALRVSRDNAVNNGVAKQISYADIDLSALKQRFDLVFINIEWGYHERHHPYYANLVNPGGLVFLSGILDTQRALALDTLSSCWDIVAFDQEGEWLAIAMKNPH